MKMILRKTIAIILIFVCTGKVLIESSLAQENPAAPASIVLIIGSKPGGGYDRYGRLVAKYLSKHLKDSIVTPVNKATAAGVPALKEIADKGADGTKLLTFNTGLLLRQLSGVSLNIDQYSWLGKASSEARVLLVGKDAGISNFQDLRTRGAGLVFVSSSYGSSAFIQTHLLNDAFGLNLKIVPGFGGNEAEAALLKGEVDGALVSESNVAPLVEAGAVVPILVFGTPRDPTLADISKGLDIAQTQDQILVARTITTLTELGRPLVAAPDLNAELLDTYRRAYHSALTDPELLAEAAAQKMPVSYMKGDQSQLLVVEMLTADGRIADMVQAVLAR